MITSIDLLKHAAVVRRLQFMTKDTSDLLNKIFPPALFKISYGPEAELDYPVDLTCFERDISVISLRNNSEDDLKKHADELWNMSLQEEAELRVTGDKPHIDYDPGTDRFSMQARILYCV